MVYVYYYKTEQNNPQKIYRVAQKTERILPVIKVYNDWYQQWMGYLLLRKIILRSAILVKWFLC